MQILQLCCSQFLLALLLSHIKVAQTARVVLLFAEEQYLRTIKRSSHADLKYKRFCLPFQEAVSTSNLAFLPDELLNHPFLLHFNAPTGVMPRGYLEKIVLAGPAESGQARTSASKVWP